MKLFLEFIILKRDLMLNIYENDLCVLWLDTSYTTSKQLKM